MPAVSSGLLLCAGLLLLQCCVQLQAAPEKHKHLPNLHPAVAAARFSNAKVQQAAVPIGPLPPQCIPKYVTDLTIPPLMPIANQPVVSEGTGSVGYVQGARDRHGDAVEEEEEEQVGLEGRPYYGPPHVRVRDRPSHTRDGDEQEEYRRRPYPEEEGPEEPETPYYRDREGYGGDQEQHEQDDDDSAYDSDRNIKRGRKHKMSYEEFMRYSNKELPEAPAPDEEEPEEAPAPTPAKSTKRAKKGASLDDDYWDHFTDFTKSKHPESTPVEGEPQPPSNADSHHQPEPQPSPEAIPTPNASQAPAAVPPPTPPPPAYVSYDISVKKNVQNVLPVASVPLPECPANFGPTDVFAYGPAHSVGTALYNWPAFTIEAQRNTEVRIRWRNELVDAKGRFLRHIFKEAIDQTLHWANPEALGGAIDSSPCHMCQMAGPGACLTDPACVTAATSNYNGPVPIATHLHGQNHVPDYSDGYTEAWYLPVANDAANYKQDGTWYQTFSGAYAAATGGTAWHPGSATSVYKNTQPASPLWFHDHALGITRLNVYAGMAGFYFLREKFPSLANGPELPGLPYPAYDGIVGLDLVREIPLAIQDRAFTNDSQLWYPLAAVPAAEALPAGPLPPRWMPEFKATLTDALGVSTNYLVMTVNGKTYPRQTVYPDAYRLRILNGCNTRTMQLRFARSVLSLINPLSAADTANLVPFYVVGNDGGFFPQIQGPMNNLEIGPAERYDVVIDFTGIAPGEFVFLLNNGPEPDTAIYDGTNNGVGLTEFTAQIMRFDVQPLPPAQTARPFTLTEQVALNNALAAQYVANNPALGPSPLPVRRVALLENLTPSGFPIAVLLGVAATNNAGANIATETPWSGPVTSNGALDVSQYWDIINLSADSHPIHLHNVDFEYLGRWQVIADPNNPRIFTDTNIPVTNPDLDPLLEVSCTQDPSGKCPVRKDTFLVLPGTRTRIGFHGPPSGGLYVWHCHLLEHEDNEMMVPLCFGNPPYPDPRRPGALMCPGPN